MVDVLNNVFNILSTAFLGYVSLAVASIPFVQSGWNASVILDTNCSRTKLTVQVMKASMFLQHRRIIMIESKSSDITYTLICKTLIL